MQPTCQIRGAEPFRASTLAIHSRSVERVIQTMRAQLSTPLSLETMAEIACLSPFHFNRIFRSIAGIPPGEFHPALRLDAAKRLLLTTPLSVTDVCFDLGYASLGTFTTRFKQLVGLSPIQLRQLSDGFTPPSLETISERCREANSLAPIHGGEVTGTITVTDAFHGLIFAGLFPKPIPQYRPVACTTLPAPGRFRIGPVPDGRYYLLAAAVPLSDRALTYLLPDAKLLVGIAEQPVLVRDGRASAPVTIALRPLDVTDPPILGVFPSLLRTPAAVRVLGQSTAK